MYTRGLRRQVSKSLRICKTTFFQSILQLTLSYRLFNIKRIEKSRMRKSQVSSTKRLLANFLQFNTIPYLTLARPSRKYTTCEILAIGIALLERSSKSLILLLNEIIQFCACNFMQLLNSENFRELCTFAIVTFFNDVFSLSDKIQQFRMLSLGEGKWSSEHDTRVCLAWARWNHRNISRVPKLYR